MGEVLRRPVRLSGSLAPGLVGGGDPGEPTPRRAGPCPSRPVQGCSQVRPVSAHSADAALLSDRVISPSQRARSGERPVSATLRSSAPVMMTFTTLAESRCDVLRGDGEDRDVSALQHFRALDGLAPGPGYSHAVTGRGRWVATSGQVALDGEGKLVGPGDPEAQTRQVFANLDRALAAACASFTDVIKLNYYVTDIAMLPVVRTIRDEYVDTARPLTSTAVQVTALAMPDLMIEIEPGRSAPTDRHRGRGRAAGTAAESAGTAESAGPESSRAAGGPGGQQRASTRISANEAAIVTVKARTGRRRPPPRPRRG